MGWWTRLLTNVPNSQIFCNTPWYELHIYWDGSLGICCQEDHKLYTTGNYNIATMTIAEWFNSEPVKEFRQGVLGNRPVSACARCYREEAVGGNSRRIKSNQKSVIFRQAFAESFAQSPGQKHFDPSGITSTHPIDIHVDLGNYCNLGCKMCNAQASSTIAAQQVRWGIESSKQYLGTDWTRNPMAWQSFKQQLLEIPGLNNIHFMGGETLLTDRFEDLVDHMIEHQRQDLCFSFVTNGTVFKPELMQKLTQFRRVGIEVSIETVDEHNAYQRQGTDTDLVLANLKQYRDLSNSSNITVTVRPAISALTVGYYAGLLRYCLDNQFIVKSLLVTDPEFLSIDVLPKDVRRQYAVSYHELIDYLDSVAVPADYNASDPNNCVTVVKEQAQMCINLLNQTVPVYQDHLQKLMVDHCRRWDQVYHLNARELYPELADLWDRHAY